MKPSLDRIKRSMELICASRNVHQRLQVISDLASSYDWRTELDVFRDKYRSLTNIAFPGSSNIWIMAHYDFLGGVGANDNASSVVNAMEIKHILPWVNVIITDGEESPHFGSGSYQFACNHRGQNIFVLNLEMTGIGGPDTVAFTYDHIDMARFISMMFESLYSIHIPIIHALFNDSTILNTHGIPSCCLTAAVCGDRIDYEQLDLTHTGRDNLDTINYTNMVELVDRIIVPTLETIRPYIDHDISSQVAINV